MTSGIVRVKKTNKGRVMLSIIDEDTGEPLAQLILEPETARQVATDLTLQSILAERKRK